MIRIRGARQHNLQGVDLDLADDQLIVFCGRSGSGKTSLAFDTLHAEGQRRYLEALALRSRTALPQLPRPDADLLDGIPPTVALEQRFDVPPGRSTVGTFTDVEAVLRVLFGRCGVQHDPATGEPIHPVTHDGIVARLVDLPDGARLHIEAPVRVGPGGDRGRRVLDEVARAGFSRVRLGDEVRALDELRPQDIGDDAIVRVVVDRIKLGPDRRDRLYDAVRTASAVGRGVVVVVADDQTLSFVDRPYSVALDRVLPELRPQLFRPMGPDACGDCAGKGEVEGARCEVCGGTGTGEAVRAVRYEGFSWPAALAATVDELRAAMAGWARTAVTGPLLEELERRLGAVARVGLGHLGVSRALATLSGSELRLLRLARQVGARLSGVLYVLDEPAAGLGPPEVARVLELVAELRAQGNAVIVVEHDAQVIAAADRVIEFGPGPGELGGRVIFDGAPGALLAADTPTGRWLSGRETVETGPVWRVDITQTQPAADFGLRGGRARGMTGIDLQLRRSALNVITGPEASGKTSALEALAAAAQARIDGGPSALVGLDGLTRVVIADAEAASRSRRSTPATFVGLWEMMRELLSATTEAKVRGLDASSFSLNVRGGRCEACKGLGALLIDLAFLPEVSVPCEVCEGRRFARDVLEVRYKGLDAGQMLDLGADEALGRLAGHPKVEDGLRALRDVGLGYVRLGQPTDTLSGGEAQRLKLARELVRAVRGGGEGTLFLLDEPTLGLHPADIAVQVALLRRLVATGSTVVVATRHPMYVG